MYKQFSRRRCSWNTVVVAAVLVPLASLAHHSVPVNFDMQSDIEVTGKITRTKWVNPHSQLTLDVVSDTGEAETWLVEMNALNTIRRLGKRLGWSTDNFVVGEKITVGGWKGRHERSVYFRRATLASGRKIIWESRLDPDLTKLE